MLQPTQLQAVRLHRNPPGQMLVANLALELDYRFPRRTEIVLEGTEILERVGPAILAMNHTDRFNYWPLQYSLYRRGYGFTATWVKGKYYQNKWLARFLSATNNIPLPSRGYVIGADFQRRAQRKPSGEEYRYLRDRLDDKEDLGPPPAELQSLFDAHQGERAWIDEVDRQFEALSRAALDLTARALRELQIRLLVFPQGTRSVRLSQGHTGVIEAAAYFRVPILPIGCSGSDKLYPGNSPFSKGGRVVYRIGEPFELPADPGHADYIDPELLPFSRAMARQSKAPLRRLTDQLMWRINELLDPEYRFPEGQGADAKADAVERFV